MKIFIFLRAFEGTDEEKIVRVWKEAYDRLVKDLVNGQGLYRVKITQYSGPITA